MGRVRSDIRPEVESCTAFVLVQALPVNAFIPTPTTCCRCRVTGGPGQPWKVGVAQPRVSTPSTPRSGAATGCGGSPRWWWGR